MYADNYIKKIGWRLSKIGKYSLHTIACLLLIVSCNNKSTSDKKAFTYNETTGIATLDPAFTLLSEGWSVTDGIGHCTYCVAIDVRA